MKENEYVVIGNIYFTKVDEDKYIITDEELSKLIIKYRTLESFFENKYNRYNKYREQAEKRIEYYHTLAHTYKVELGRCRRKLTRIYAVFNNIETETVTRLIDKCDYRALIWILEFIHKIKMLLKVV